MFAYLFPKVYPCHEYPLSGWLFQKHPFFDVGFRLHKFKKQMQLNVYNIESNSLSRSIFGGDGFSVYFFGTQSHTRKNSKGSLVLSIRPLHPNLWLCLFILRVGDSTAVFFVVGWYHFLRIFAVSIYMFLGYIAPQ